MAEIYSLFIKPVRSTFGPIVLIVLCLAAALPATALEIELEEAYTDFDQPLFLTHAGDGSGRIFVVEHAGVIKVIESGKTLPTPFLDISPGGLDRVYPIKEMSDERGLLGIAFHPKYKENRKFYLNYTRKGDFATVIVEYKSSATDPNVADPTETLILGPVHQPQYNHNGGMVEFGPDGFLYIGLGDGGFRADVGKGHNPKIGNGQDTTNLLGKILRIDVDHPAAPLAYGIPADNPFAKNPGENRPEIYAWGLRNPWRFSFDRETGRLFCGDVGQDLWEEIDIITNGGNYGWRRMEGNHCFNPKESCKAPDLILPIHEYKHDEATGGLSVTGGYVYRGKQFPAMQGLYFFADHASGRFWSLKETAPDKWESTEHFREGFYMPSFGEDEAGELYLCNFWRGSILKVVDRDAAK